MPNRTRTVRYPNASPTDAQVATLRRLFEETKSGHGVDVEAWFAQLITQQLWTRGHVSTLISQLIARQHQARRDADALGSQRMTIGELVGGPQASAPADEYVPASTTPLPIGDTLDGIHIIDNEAFRVGTMNRRRWERDIEVNDPSRRRFVWRLIVSPNGQRARWLRLGSLRMTRTNGQGQVRVPGRTYETFVTLNASTLATLDQAREFGTAFGICLNCGRTLVVEQSIERSLGPVCYRRISAQQARRDAHVLATRIAPVDPFTVFGNASGNVTVNASASHGGAGGSGGVVMSSNGIVTVTTP